MTVTIISVAASAAVLLLGTLYIRRQYRLFCAREDQKERIAVLRKKVDSARAYIRKTYNTAFDTSIQDNLIPKIDFLERLIMNKAPDAQERELGFLLDMLTETFTRLSQNYDDVPSIVAPLNTMRDRLVQEHLQYIKDHMDEEWLLE